MAATGKWYGLAIKSAFNKEIDFDSDTIKVMLCTSTYTPNQDTHQYKSSVTNEHGATGTYSAGGATLASKTVSYNSSTNVFSIDAADVTWTGGTWVNVQYAVIYGSTGTDSTSPLIGYIDFGSAQSFTGDLTLQFDAAGIATVTVA